MNRDKNQTGKSLETAARLTEEFGRRRAKNTSYSLRAFARDLGLSPAFLSRLLSGKRLPSPDILRNIALALRLSAKDIKAWEATLKRAPKKRRTLGDENSTDFAALDLDQFRLIADWWCLAVLDLTLTEGFQESDAWISQRLGIPKKQALDAIDRCMRVGLMERDESTGRLRKSKNRIKFQTQQSTHAIRAYHRSMILKALSELDYPERFDNRDISSISVAMDPANMPAAKKRIQEFQRDFLREFAGGAQCTDLYQFNTQLFALTQSKKEKL